MQTLLLLIPGTFCVGCSVLQHRAPATAAAAIVPPSLKRHPDRERFVEQGWPFPVHAIVSDGEGSTHEQPFYYLRDYFLRPIAQSGHADLVQKIDIDAFSLESAQWKCSVILKDGLGTITLTHLAAFCDDRDAHNFESAARYVVTSLNDVYRLVPDFRR